MHRSDGSGTTFIFTDYLSKVSADWKSKVGANTAVEWPVGIGAKGNEGVANNVGQTKGSIGYVEYAYAKQNKLTNTKLVNKDGKSVAPTAESFMAAAANADWESTPGFDVILTNEPGAESWPIAGATFILMHKQPQDPAAAARGPEVLRLGLRQRRQDGRRSRLRSDARQGRRRDQEGAGRPRSRTRTASRCLHCRIENVRRRKAPHGAFLLIHRKQKTSCDTARTRLEWASETCVTESPPCSPPGGEVWLI